MLLYDFCMPAGVYNFTIEQGSTWSRTITVRDSAGDIQNLSGYTARMHIRKDIDAAATLLELTTANGRIVIDGSAGTVTLSLDATTAASLTKGGVYDIELVSAGGEVTRLLEGQVILRKNVTR